VVDAAWLLKALGICFVAALVCAYGTLCLLVYQGTWQLVLHPSRAVARTPAAVGLAYSEVQFDATETGQPRLTGWWLPAVEGAGSQPGRGGVTILFLHDGTGSLADTVPALARLHGLGLNLFAIDYRGFGASDASVHPSAERMAEDTAAALRYLVQTRHLDARAIVPYGSGLGASLAVQLAGEHPELPSVVLDNPDPDPAATAVAADPSRIVPVRLLFGGQFAIAAPLASLATPKLLIAGGPLQTARGGESSELQSLFRSAASPKIAVSLAARSGTVEYTEALERFLDQYLARH
jgi:pimeloyl-ACP methyl ester carboxylesterase